MVVQNFHIAEALGHINKNTMENKYNSLIDNNNLQKSLDDIEKILNRDGDSYLELLDTKGAVLYLMDRYDEAINVYETILNRDDSYLPAYQALVNIYLCKSIEENQAYYEEIIDLHRRIEENNKGTMPYSILADAYRGLGEYNLAIRCFEKALTEETDSYFIEDIFISLADCYKNKKDYQEAIKFYDKAIDESIKDNGDDRECSDYYAYKREIYSILNDEANVSEMDELYNDAVKKYYEHKSFRKKSKNNDFSKIIKKIEKVGVQEDTFDKEVFELTIGIMKECYSDHGINKFEIVADCVLEDLYEGESIREKKVIPIKKARLVNLYKNSF